jgi:phosphate transport system substrate-binding protein
LNVYRTVQIRALPLGLIGMLVLAGCVTTGSPSEVANPGAQTVLVSGSSTVEPISSLVAEDFAARSEGFEYEVDGPGTGDGFALFCEGQTDISDASRPISEEETAACEASGIGWVELKVAVDGISVITSTTNDAVSCLSFGDLYALLGPESQGFDNWNAADELAAELDGEFGTSNAPFADTPLDVTAPGEESGTYDSFLEIVFGDIAEARDQEEVARPDYTASPDDNVIIEGIAGADGSLGWVGFAFYEQNADAVTALEVDGGDGCVAPTAATIASNEYPISRDLFIYVNTDRADANPAIADFVDYYLSDEGIAAVAEAGYVDLTSEALEETRAAWEGR